MKKQIIVIHGGDTFDTYEDYFAFLKNEKMPRFESMMQKDWKNNLQENLGDEYEIIIPKMPNKQNARYSEWRIWFEKHVPFFDEETVFIGHSLGGIFLAKYLSENKYPKKILATILIAAPFDEEGKEYSLGDFMPAVDLSLFEKQSQKIILYHSKDDPVVPFSDAKMYQEALTGAEIRTFEEMGHFNSERLPAIEEEVKSVWVQNNI